MIPSDKLNNFDIHDDDKGLSKSDYMYSYEKLESKKSASEGEISGEYD